MERLSRADLWSLEEYAEARSEFRATVLGHKRTRQVQIGAHASLTFEDRITVKYQIQEMLRVEKIFERAAIEEELQAYNPLIPDGANLKATLMIEYEDVQERRVALMKLKGVEDCVWVQIGAAEKVWAIADEDLDRENDDKTSAVHFLRFEFSAAMVSDAKVGAGVSIGIDHPEYRHVVTPVSEDTSTALVADFA